jgi:hypothetical protein
MSEDVFRWIITVGVLVAAVSFVVQAVLVFAMYRVAKATEEKVMPLVHTTTPLISDLRRLVEVNGPRVTQVTADSAEIVKVAREHVQRVGELVKECTDRTRTQMARLDHLVDEAAEKLEDAGDAVRTVVLRPVREVNGVLHGLKAALAVVAQGRRESVDHATQDEEMFI